MKNLLLISPSISDMYKDIIASLNLMNINVDYIEDQGNSDDPDFIRIKKRQEERENGRLDYLQDNAVRWRSLLESRYYNKSYDYLLVIDGMSMSPVVFEILKQRNSQIWCVNYLFDSTRSLYRFQNFFKYYDLVASFDKRDCAEYKLLFLPIYWVDEPAIDSIYKFFAVGGFSVSRYRLFKNIGDFAKRNGYVAFCKLFHQKESSFIRMLTKYIVKRIQGIKNVISPRIYYSDYIITTSIPSTEYRTLLLQSEIIVDSVNYEQDGMTARFMWALGLKKKIITTNKNILGYDCFDSNQIFIIDDSFNQKKFKKFVETPFVMSEKNERLISKWRIDNWLLTLLNKDERNI